MTKATLDFEVDGADFFYDSESAPIFIEWESALEFARFLNLGGVKGGKTFYDAYAEFTGVTENSDIIDAINATVAQSHEGDYSVRADESIEIVGLSHVIESVQSANEEDGITDHGVYETPEWL